jgi:hypothetical protein
LDKIEEKSDNEANANISEESIHISDDLDKSVGDGQLSDAGVESIVDSDEEQTSMDRLRQSPIASFLPRPDRAVMSGRVIVKMSSSRQSNKSNLDQRSIPRIPIFPERPVS